MLAHRLLRPTETACHSAGGLPQCGNGDGARRAVRFNELVRLLENDGFSLVKEKGSIRYYAKAGWPNLIRVDYHGSREVPTGTCHSIMKAAGLKKP